MANVCPLERTGFIVGPRDVCGLIPSLSVFISYLFRIFNFVYTPPTSLIIVIISSSPCVRNKTGTQFPHRSLPRATVDASVQNHKPSSCSYFSTVFPHVSFGLPLFLLPSGAQARTLHGITSFFISPIHHCLLSSLELLTSFVFVFVRVLLRCSLSSASILCRFSKGILCWKISSLFSPALVIRRGHSPGPRTV